MAVAELEADYLVVGAGAVGDGSLRQDGPEAGLHERASAPEVCAYYDRVLRTHLLASGKVRFYPNCDYLGEGRFVSRVSGRHYGWGPAARRRCPLPVPGDPGDHAAPVRGRRRGGRRGRQRPGSPGGSAVAVRDRRLGQDATDACIWLLDNGVDPGAICWVRSREPWMLNRAAVQPDPVVFLGTAAAIMRAAAAASTADDVFFQLEDAA